MKRTGPGVLFLYAATALGNRWVHVSGWLILYQMLFACASQAPPGGGPEDKIPPEIIATTPHHDSVRVGSKTSVRITFSEKMEKTSTEQNIFVSPAPAHAPKYEWHKNDLVIHFADTLKVPVTCVITVGTGAKDVHGNALKRSFSFAFSTGDSIDRGLIGGRIFHDRLTGVSIWAYQMADTDPFQRDSAIYLRRADYITQPDAEGRYELSYLAPGVYRVFAVMDANQDYLYSPGTDRIGIPRSDIILDRDTRCADVHFRLTQEDTARFAVISAEMSDPATMTISFSKPLSTALFDGSSDFTDSLPKYIHIIRASDGQNIPLRGIMPNNSNSMDLKILTDGLDTAGIMYIQMENIFSQFGDTLEARTDTVKGINGLTTERARFLNVKKIPSKVTAMDSLTFIFDQGLDRNRFEKAVSITDSANQAIELLFRWANAGLVHIKPLRLFQPGMTYTLRIADSLAQDWQGLRLWDTISLFSLSCYPADSLSVISGSVNGVPDSMTSILMLQNASDHAVYRMAYLTGVRDFRFDNVIPGKYFLSGYVDENGDRMYNYGRVAPFSPSEPFVFYSDSLMVRPNWETVNIQVNFKMDYK